MAQIVDISQWSEQPWWNTGGTRNKKIFLNPSDNERYYFKQSLKREKKDYKYEFWSEIIASELGQQLGFNVLRYDIAVWGNELGCLSKSMINPDKEELVEGGKYLQAFDNTFNPDDRKLRSQYTFDLIASTLEAFQLLNFLDHILEIIVFDALIGNSDRHQENWAFITEHSKLSKSLATIEYDFRHVNLEHAPRWFKWVARKTMQLTGTQEIMPELQRVKLLTVKNIRVAPIYDSGCSFGRELTEERVLEMSGNEDLIQNYIGKGQSEIHAESGKLSHFDFLKLLLADKDYAEKIKSTIVRVKERLNESSVSELINKIDVGLVNELAGAKIPEPRKRLIYKLIISRADSLSKLV